MRRHHARTLPYTAVLFFILLWTTTRTELTTERTSTDNSAAPHVCIVGAGIAAAAAAYHISESSTSYRITVFEKEPEVGGRIQNVQFPDAPPLEIGASILASTNRLMRFYVSAFNLTTDVTSDVASLGLWDGQHFVYRTASSFYRTASSTLWRYGLSVLRSRWFVARLLRHFDRLYDIHDNSPRKSPVSHVPFASVEAFFNRSGLYSLTAARFDTVCARLFYARFEREMVTAITRVNYGQEVHAMNALAGAVALAGSGAGLWRIAGGNNQVVRHLFRASGATLHTGVTVIAVDRANTSRYLLHVRAEDGGEARDMGCDAVVLAAPYERAMMEVPHDMARLLDVGRTFQVTVATFVRGVLSERTFGVDPPDAILTTAHAESNFTSIGKNFAGVNGSMPIWKVFSRRPLVASELAVLFADDFDVLATRSWHAYPQFSPPERFAPFVVDQTDGGAFFYTSTIESAGSAMEMSALAGANAAALVRASFEPEFHTDGSSSPERPDPIKIDL